MKEIYVEGHRGYCAKFPENTMISYEAAIDLGVDAFEFDIWLSSDKVPVLMHDQNCLRTCGYDRNLRDMNLAEIKQLDAGYAKKFGNQFVDKGIQVPTLEELCEMVNRKRPGMPLGVEIKEYTEECVDISVAMLNKYNLFENAWFYAFHAPTIRYLKEKYNARTMGYPDFQMGEFFPGAYDYYDEIGLAMNIVKSEIYPIYENKNMPIHMFCADTEEAVAECLKRKPSLITANDPVPLMKILGREIGKVDYCEEK